MEPPPSLSTPAAALPSVPPINLKRATKSEETSAPPPTVSPRLFQKTPRSDSKDKERASKEKLVSPRRGFKKSSSKAALHDNAGPLQRDTKQAELIKSKSGNTVLLENRIFFFLFSPPKKKKNYRLERRRANL